jgi:hypothetical protein
MSGVGGRARLCRVGGEGLVLVVWARYVCGVEAWLNTTPGYRCDALGSKCPRCNEQEGGTMNSVGAESGRAKPTGRRKRREMIGYEVGRLTRDRSSEICADSTSPVRSVRENLRRKEHHA